MSKKKDTVAQAERDAMLLGSELLVLLGSELKDLSEALARNAAECESLRSDYMRALGAYAAVNGKLGQLGRKKKPVARKR